MNAMNGMPKARWSPAEAVAPEPAPDTEDIEAAEGPPAPDDEIE